MRGAACLLPNPLAGEGRGGATCAVILLKESSQ